MKILTWNCNGAFRKKFRKVAAEFNADIYVIQECENPVTVKERDFKDWAQNFLWTGDPAHKGLGIFAKNNKITINRLAWDSQDLEHFIACRVNNDFNLLGTWCHGASSPTYAYIGQLWKYLQVHKARLNKSIIAGDFNSNTIWDKRDRKWNHSVVVKELGEYRIESLYHMYFRERQGAENQPTFYLQKNLSKAYHIDYIFASDEFCETLKAVNVGQSDKWLALSDHMPVICEFRTKHGRRQK